MDSSVGIPPEGLPAIRQRSRVEVNMRQSNLPSGDLLGSRDDYFNTCVPLFAASIMGDWNTAEIIFMEHPGSLRSAITGNYETALHVASSVEETKQMESFVSNLVDLMGKEDLQLQNKHNNTAFCLAASAGNIRIAKIMLRKNQNLLNISGADEKLPLYMSAEAGKYETTKYLYGLSKRLSDGCWTPQNRGWLLYTCVECNFFDVALRMVTDCPELAAYSSVLKVLARKRDAFTGGEQNLLNSISRILRMMVGRAEEDCDALKLLTIIWENTIRKMAKHEGDMIIKGPSYQTHPSIGSMRTPIYSSGLLFVAAEMGNTRFVIEILRAYPDLIWNRNEDDLTIFHVAVKNRHHDIYNLLYEIGAMKNLIIPLQDNEGNNILHLVGKTSVKMRPQAVGATLFMQRELLWFKEIEKMVPPSYREKKNKLGQTPYELFSDENKDMVLQGLKWMKDCMVVSMLIVTLTLAIAFTVSGGYNQENGIPIFICERSFLVFVVADAISLFSSTTSLLVFLSIVTSRLGERDFMYSLHRKVMIGLVTFFISVAAMMIAFGTSFFALYRKGLIWIPILIAMFAALPVFVFAVLQFPLLVDMYDSRYLFKPKKRILYDTKPRF